MSGFLVPPVPKLPASFSLFFKKKVTLPIMDMAEARELTPGTQVMYRATPNGPFEDGTVVRVGESYVFVLYRGDYEAKATDPRNLEVRTI